MMRQKPDMTVAEVDQPVTGYCASGHEVTDGALFNGAPVRWFQVTHRDVSGVYCEPCLVVANAMKRMREGSR